MKRFKLALAILAAGAALLAPIAIYIWHFGWRITSDHGQWAEMGSAMAGIYAPLLGLLTLGILWQQHQTLKAQHTLQREQQSFLHEQHVQNTSRERLDNVLQTLLRRLSEQDSKDVIGAYQTFSDSDITEELTSGYSYGKAQTELTTLWIATYNCFAFFKTTEDPLRLWFYGAMREKIMAEIGMATCITLDLIALLQEASISHYEYFTELNTHVAKKAETKPDQFPAHTNGNA
ncbi:hypothetical protein [Halopseudomonas salina]|uniref:Phage abortive infection protein n=1 Tax=Halopseudomonas salina TaxID=1323744 RepID=A0ABQ1NY59_9GAMM|nr:hypothetical protein [Halopseudomonas salina]GGC87530.1 hypothetical protein GCM10007418_04100 [Halopseudomonas salina]